MVVMVVVVVMRKGGRQYRVSAWCPRCYSRRWRWPRWSSRQCQHWTRWWVVTVVSASVSTAGVCLPKPFAEAILHLCRRSGLGHQLVVPSLHTESLWSSQLAVADRASHPLDLWERWVCAPFSETGLHAETWDNLPSLQAFSSGPGAW